MGVLYGRFTVIVQDAPVGNGESQWILKTETFPTLSSLVKVIKEPWEAQFGVELQKNLYPSVMVRPWRSIVTVAMNRGKKMLGSY